MTVAVCGLITRWSNAPAFTIKVAVPVTPPLAAVTVCVPGMVAEQLGPAHEPSGVIEKVAVDVRSPVVFPKASRPVAVYACFTPSDTVALAGATTMLDSAAG